MAETTITVRGEFAAWYPAERATVAASVTVDGDDREMVFARAVESSDAVRGLIEGIHDKASGPVTWWSSGGVRVWSERPWNNQGTQLPLVFRAAVDFSAKFRDFEALARWVESAAGNRRCHSVVDRVGAHRRDPHQRHGGGAVSRREGCGRQGHSLRPEHRARLSDRDSAGRPRNARRSVRRGWPAARDGSLGDDVADGWRLRRASTRDEARRDRRGIRGGRPVYREVATRSGSCVPTWRDLLRAYRCVPGGSGACRIRACPWRRRARPSRCRPRSRSTAARGCIRPL